MEGCVIVSEPDVARLESVAVLLRALSYPPRLRIAMAIRDRALTPRGLSTALPMETTTVAHHLRHLRHAGVVRRERRGSSVVYVIAPGAGRLLDLLFG